MRTLYVVSKERVTCWSSHAGDESSPAVVMEHTWRRGSHFWADHFELGASAIRALKDEAEARMFGLVPPALAVSR